MAQRIEEGKTVKIGKEGNFDEELIIAANPDVMIQLRQLASKSYHIEQLPALVLQIIGYKVNEYP